MSKPHFTEKQLAQFWQGYAQSDAPEPMLKTVAGLRAMTDEDEPNEKVAAALKAHEDTKEPEQSEIKGPPMVGDVVESRSGRIMTVVAVYKDEAWIQNEDYRDVTYVRNIKILSRHAPKVGDVFVCGKNGIVRRCTSANNDTVGLDESYTQSVEAFMSLLNSGEIRRIYRSEK
jgi:hypothetical protein